MVGRVTPCAPFGKLLAARGAHGATRPTPTLYDGTILRCRGTKSAVGEVTLWVVGRQRTASLERTAL